jgi:hypothetical protein
VRRAGLADVDQHELVEQQLLQLLLLVEQRCLLVEQQLVLIVQQPVLVQQLAIEQLVEQQPVLVEPVLVEQLLLEQLLVEQLEPESVRDLTLVLQRRAWGRSNPHPVPRQECHRPEDLRHHDAEQPPHPLMGGKVPLHGNDAERRQPDRDGRHRGQHHQELNDGKVPCDLHTQNMGMQPVPEHMYPGGHDTLP